MELIYCPNCGKRSGFKRALGFGTFFMVLITLGLWLLAIPLYPARCINCGLTRSSAFWENLRNNPRRAITASRVIAGFVVVFIIFQWLSNPTPDHHADVAATAETAQAPVELVTAHSSGQEFSLGHWSYMLADAKWLPLTPLQDVLSPGESSPYRPETPDSLYLVLDVVVRNDGNSEGSNRASLVPSFELIDGRDELMSGTRSLPGRPGRPEVRSYRQSLRRYVGYAMFPDLLTMLNPGMTMRGQVIFDVPPGDQYALYFEGGYKSGKSTIAAVPGPQTEANATPTDVDFRRSCIDSLSASYSKATNGARPTDELSRDFCECALADFKQTGSTGPFPDCNQRLFGPQASDQAQPPGEPGAALQTLGPAPSPPDRSPSQSTPPAVRQTSDQSAPLPASAQDTHVSPQPILRTASDSLGSGSLNSSSLTVPPSQSKPPLIRPEPLVNSPREIPVPRRTGSIAWSGKVSRGQILTITGNGASLGRVDGSLPQVPVSVAVHWPFEVVEQPTPANGWTLKIRAVDSGKHESLIEWTGR